MTTTNIPVARCYPSPTNPRGPVDTKSEAFAHLVASIREKGLLVPVIARRDNEGRFEIVAGSRRLAAAKAAALRDIPADVRKLSDKEAREIQIIENLQRADVHPLDEAAAYRDLIEKSQYDTKSIAAKVGKPENYIRTRLFLTNLCPDAAKEYRGGQLSDGHAAEIARLSPQGDQQKALTYIRERNRYGKSLSTKDLHDWIEDFFVELAFQPWLKDKDAMAAVGPCVECPKNTSTLFGEVKVGACTTTRCLKRKLGKYIKWTKEREPEIFFVRNDYGPHSEGVLGYSSYDKVAKGSKDAKKALIVEGTGRGKTIYIKTRSAQVSRMTPEQKKKHDLQVAAEKAKREREEAARQKKRDDAMATALARVAWPMTDKHLDVLFAITVERTCESGTVARRRKIDAPKDADGDYKDADKALSGYYAKATPADKLRIVFEMMLEDTYRRDEFLKKL